MVVLVLQHCTLAEKSLNQSELNADSTEIRSNHVSGSVIQATERQTFDDDLRSGGLLCFISMNASVFTELADSMVTLGEPRGD